MTTLTELRNPIFKDIEIITSTRYPDYVAGHKTEIVDEAAWENWHRAIQVKNWAHDSSEAVTICYKRGPVKVSVEGAKLISQIADVYIHTDARLVKLHQYYEAIGSDGKVYYLCQETGESTKESHLTYIPQTRVTFVWRKRVN